MTSREKLAAWLGLFGLATGFYVFAVYVWPKLKRELS